MRTIGAVANAPWSISPVKPSLGIRQVAEIPGCRPGIPSFPHGVVDALRVQAESIIEVSPAKRGHVDDRGREGPGVGAHVLVVAGDDIAAGCPARRLESRSGVRFQAIAEAEAKLLLR